MTTDTATTQANLTVKYAPHYNLCAAIINLAVKEFNKGTVAQKQDAAAFFRGDRCAWMLKAVNADVSTLVKHRLNADPYDLKSLARPNKEKIKSAHPPVYIEWKGVKMTATEWAEYLGITVNTFRARVKNSGMSVKTFSR